MSSDVQQLKALLREALDVCQELTRKGRVEDAYCASQISARLDNCLVDLEELEADPDWRVRSHG